MTTSVTAQHQTAVCKAKTKTNFFGLTGLVLRPTVSDHITDHHHHHHHRRHLIMTPPPRLGIKRWCCLTSVCLTSVAYIRPKSRTGMPRKTKIGTEIAHFTRDADTTLRSKGQRSQGRGYIVAASRTACSFIKCNIKSHNEQLTNRTCKARWEFSHSPELHSYNTAWDKSNDAQK